MYIMKDNRLKSEYYCVPPYIYLVLYPLDIVILFLCLKRWTCFEGLFPVLLKMWIQQTISFSFFQL